MSLVEKAFLLKSNVENECFFLKLTGQRNDPIIGALIRGNCAEVSIFVLKKGCTKNR